MARDYRPDEERSLSRVFFVLSLILILVSMYVVVDETFVRRPWKRFQTAFYEMEYKKLQHELAAKEPALASAAKEIDAKRRQVEETLARDAEYQKARQELDRVKLRLADATQEQQFAKSRLDADYYLYKTAEHEGDREETERYKAMVDRLQRQVEQLEVPVAALTERRQALQAQIEKAEAPLHALDQQHRKLFSDVKRIHDRVDQITVPVFGLFRVPQAPEVKQTVLTGLNHTNFNEPLMRVERCETCHVGIDRPGFEDQPQPYATHPHRGIILAHHPVEKFGCTVCHAGQGVALTVQTAHGNLDLFDQTPRLAEPLLTGTWLQSQCRKCHAEDLPGLQFASAIARGQELFQTMGCPGCHIARGFEDQPKVAPDLRRIASKADAAWMIDWIQAPKSYLPRTRMPNFRLSRDEAKGVAAYLLASSQPFHGPPYPGNGDAAAGEKVVESIGCLGCHQINGKGNTFAPDLSRVASKVNADWLFAWVKNPQDYLPGTRMPNLRLSDEQAANITAYLMTLGKKKDEPVLTAELRDKKLIEQGNQLIGRYGCYGCHEIAGMENRVRIGAELTTFADKRPWEMVFGDVPLVKKQGYAITPIPRLIGLYQDGKKIEESWEGWAFGKLKNSRMYATDRIIQQMPDFAFSDADASALLVLLRSFTDETLPTDYISKPAPQVGLRIAGTQVMEKYNCLGCHNLAGQGGNIAPNLAYEGGKVRGDWLLSFLKQPHQIRPLVQAHMPTFPLSGQELTRLRDYIMADFVDERIPKSPQVAQKLTPELAAQGEKLYWEKYPCFTCHHIQGKAGGASVGPDLTEAWRRLNPDWIVQWVKNPQAFEPTTVMPNLGLSDAEATAIVAYLESLGRQISAQAASGSSAAGGASPRAP